MGYLTHQFSNAETLDRARRWLVHAGIDRTQIESVVMGIPRIAVKLAPGQAAQVGMIIDAAEHSDPHGYPSFWDLAHQQYSSRKPEPEVAPAITETGEPRGFVVGYHAVDDRWDPPTHATAVQMVNAFLDR